MANVSYVKLDVNKSIRPLSGAADAVKELRRLTGLSQTGFADWLEVGQTDVAKWETGKRPVPYRIVLQLANGVDDPTQREFWRNAAGLDVPSSASELAKAFKPRLLAEIPLVSGFVGAGPDYRVDDDIEAMLALPRGLAPNATETSCIRVKGNSMEPMIPDGTLVAVDHSQRRIEKLIEKIVAARHTVEGVKFKRLKQHEGKNLLVSDNPVYPPIDLESGWEIIGRVVWFIQTA